MLEPAQAGHRNHMGSGGWLRLDRPSIRSVLVQRIMDPIFFVIADVFADQAAKVGSFRAITPGGTIQGFDVTGDGQRFILKTRSPEAVAAASDSRADSADTTRRPRSR